MSATTPSRLLAVCWLAACMAVGSGCTLVDRFLKGPTPCEQCCPCGYEHLGPRACCPDVCYGYRSTCWWAWPEECGDCNAAAAQTQGGEPQRASVPATTPSAQVALQPVPLEPQPALPNGEHNGPRRIGEGQPQSPPSDPWHMKIHRTSASEERVEDRLTGEEPMEPELAPETPSELLEATPESQPKPDSPTVAEHDQHSAGDEPQPEDSSPLDPSQESAEEPMGEPMEEPADALASEEPPTTLESVPPDSP